MTDLLGLIWRSRWIILMAVSIAITLSTYKTHKERYYTAYGTILIKKAETSPLQALSERMGGYRSFMDDHKVVHSQYIRHLRSESFLQLVAKNMLASEDPKFLRSLFYFPQPSWKRALSRIGFKIDQGKIGPDVITPENLASIIGSRVLIESKSVDTLAIRSQTTGPYSAAKLVNYVLEAGVSYITSKNLAELDEARDFLTHQVTDIKSQITDLQNRLIFIEKEAGEKSINLSENSATGVMPRLETQILEAQINFSHKDSMIKRLEAEASPEERRGYIFNRSIQKLRNEKAYWKSRLNSMTALQREFNSARGKIPKFRQSLTNITRQIEFEYRYIEELSKQIMQIEVQRISLRNKILVDEWASQGSAWQVAEYKKNGIFASLIAIIAALLFMYFKNAVHPKIHREEDLEAFGLPTLGTLPSLRTADKKKLIPSHRLNPLVLDEVYGIPAISNSLIKLLPKIQYHMTFKAKKGLNVITVASPSEGEGRTFTALGLAYYFAQVKKKVLLIDCDFRHPVLTELFHLSNNQGLSDMVSGKAEFAHSYEQIAQNLCLIPRGIGEKGLANYYMPDHFVQVIESAKKYFDVIIVDTPPMLTEHDAEVAGINSDLVIISTMEGKTTNKELAKSIADFKNCGVNDMAFILNDSKEYDQSNMIPLNIKSNPRDKKRAA